MRYKRSFVVAGVYLILAAWGGVAFAAGRQARIDPASSPPNALKEHGYWTIRENGLPAVDVPDTFNLTPDTVACTQFSADARQCLSWGPYTPPPAPPSPAQQATDRATGDPLVQESVKAVLRAIRGRL